MYVGGRRGRRLSNSRRRREIRAAQFPACMKTYNTVAVDPADSRASLRDHRKRILHLRECRRLLASHRGRLQPHLHCAVASPRRNKGRRFTPQPQAGPPPNLVDWRAQAADSVVFPERRPRGKTFPRDSNRGFVAQRRDGDAIPRRCQWIRASSSAYRPMETSSAPAKTLHTPESPISSRPPTISQSSP